MVTVNQTANHNVHKGRSENYYTKSSVLFTSTITRIKAISVKRHELKVSSKMIAHDSKLQICPWTSIRAKSNSFQIGYCFQCVRFSIFTNNRITQECNNII